MKRVIITGPTGAIGIALIKHLLSNNIEVLAICRKDSKRMIYLPNHPLLSILQMNLSELYLLPAQISKSYDTFYHLGWDGTFGDSRNNIREQLKNVQYTLDAATVASQLGCNTFVGAGSQAEYGRVEGILHADTPTFPENGYGIAKLCAGQMSRVLCEQNGIRHIWTRILSIYGPYDGENTMIMSTIKKLLHHQEPDLTLGEQQWDYLYSSDAGKALYLLGEKGHHGKIYCIGSGKMQLLSSYIRQLRDIINPNASLGFGRIPYSEKQVMFLCADITELEKDTGFSVDYTFEAGIKETIQWCREHYQ